MVFLHEDTEPGSRSSSGRLRPADAGIQDRYATWAEAELGHIEICEKLAHALTLPSLPHTLFKPEDHGENTNEGGQRP